MKKEIISIFLCLLFIIVIGMGCKRDVEIENPKISSSPLISNEVESVAPIKITTRVISEDDIRNDTAYGEVIKIDIINDQYVLATSKWNTGINIYVVHDLYTGESEVLPTAPNYAELVSFDSENFITFTTNGKNTESPITDIPSLIHCIRIEDSESTHHYVTIYKELNFPFYGRVSTGSKEMCMLLSGKLTYDGIQLKFIPVEGKESFFYAAAVDLPPLKIKYDEKGGLLYLDISAEQFNINTFEDIDYSQNEYINDINLEIVDENVRITIDISEQVLSYNLRTKTINGGVVLEMNFNEY